MGPVHAAFVWITVTVLLQDLSLNNLELIWPDVSGK